MPSRVTLADALSSGLPDAVGMCSTRDRTKLIALINEVQQRLITEGSWWGTTMRYKCIATEGRLVWPRQVAAILAAAVCNSPIKNRDEFFEFIELGFGLQDSDHIGEGLLARDTSPVFSQVVGSDKKLKLYCDLPADVGLESLFLGYDENNNWIRTMHLGALSDGEWIAASLAGTLSVNKFSVITGVQNPLASGTRRVYEYSTTTLLQRAIARYDYDETNPSYRVSYIAENENCVGTDSKTVEVVAKLDFIPVRNDSDYLLIGNIPAITDLAAAIVRANKEATQQARAVRIASGLNLAKATLEAEVRHYRGNPQAHISVTGSSGVAGEPTEPLI